MDHRTVGNHILCSFTSAFFHHTLGENGLFSHSFRFHDLLPLIGKGTCHCLDRCSDNTHNTFPPFIPAPSDFH